MSMLAERKRKQKWCLNPRGKDWSEDSNKFGQKLLEKMGWTKGKGLGANEDGITQHVKVSYKHDNKGMGFKEESDPWTENEVGFANLLKNLSAQNENSRPLASNGGSADNSECSNVLNIKSLENKSRSSRARVHYQKFTRGKDLSRYSMKDLSQIFGKSSMNIEMKSDEDQVTSTTSFEEPSDESYNNQNLTVSNTNMTDYFKRKMKHNKIETVTSSNADADSVPVIDTTMPPPNKERRQKKKKSHTVNEIYESQNPDSSQSDIIRLKRVDGSTDVKTKEAMVKLEKVDWNGNSNKSKICKSFQPNVELENIDYYVEKKNYCKNKQKQRNEDSLKIKLKKKHTYDNPALNINDADTIASNDIENNNLNEVERKIKKKKKKHGIENPALDLSTDEPYTKKCKKTFISYPSSDSETTVTVKSIPKKRKRSRSIERENSSKRNRSMCHESGYENPAFSPNSIGPVIVPEGCEGDKKKTGMIHISYTTKPILPNFKSALKKKSTSNRPRKSVNINESLNQEKFITDDSENSQDDIVDEDTSISERIDNYQNELENSLNERKCVIGKDNTCKKFKNIALKKLSQRRLSVEFPGVKHENIIKGYGNKN